MINLHLSLLFPTWQVGEPGSVQDAPPKFRGASFRHTYGLHFGLVQVEPVQQGVLLLLLPKLVYEDRRVHSLVVQLARGEQPPALGQRHARHLDEKEAIAALAPSTRWAIA